MAATKYDFSIEQGTSFILSLTYKDKDKTLIITNKSISSTIIFTWCITYNRID